MPDDFTHTTNEFLFAITYVDVQFDVVFRMRERLTGNPIFNTYNTQKTLSLSLQTYPTCPSVVAIVRFEASEMSALHRNNSGTGVFI